MKRLLISILFAATAFAAAPLPVKVDPTTGAIVDPPIALSTIETPAGAQAKADAAQAAAIQRANHTGTQQASTISDFAAAVAAEPVSTATQTALDNKIETTTSQVRLLRDFRRKLFGVSNGSQTLVSVAVIGDSWSALGGHWLSQAAPLLKGYFGDSGPGYCQFGGVYGSYGPADETNATVTTSGTWSNISNSAARGIDGTEVSSTEIAARKTITLSATQTTTSVVLHYLKQANGGTFRYRFNSGSWTTIDSANATTLYATASLAGVPTSAAWVLDVEVLVPGSAGVVLFGAELNSSTRGIRLNRVAYPGKSSQAFAEQDSTLWAAGMSALNPDCVVIMLGTNDRNFDVSAATFSAYIQTVITRLRAVKPGMDIILVQPAENLAGNAIPITDYRDAQLALARANLCGFVDLFAEFGSSTSEYNDAAPRVLFSSGNPLHPTAIGRIQIADAICRYIATGLRRTDVIPAGGLTSLNGSIKVFGSLGRFEQNPPALSSSQGYLLTNAANSASTSQLNPGILVYNGAGAHYGMDLGSKSGQFRTRIFCHTGNSSAVALSGCNNPTQQSDFTDWLEIDAASALFNVPVIATTYNGNTITTGTGTLTLAAGKTLAASNTLTLTATDGSTLAIGSGGTLGTAAYTAATAYATSAQGTKADTADAVHATTPLATYAAGTAYSLTASDAVVDFGTTDPTIEFATAGTYLVHGRALLKYNGATYAGNETATLHLQRTNNTPAAITNATTTAALRIITTITDTVGVMPLPPVIYTASAGDIVTIYGAVSATPSAGSVDCTEASIVAVRLY